MTSTTDTRTDLVWLITAQDIARASVSWFDAAGLPPPPVPNVTAIAVLGAFLNAPYLGIATNTICFGLALLNFTWSLTRLITEHPTGVQVLAFLQVGYIFDWLRAASLCLGQTFAAFDPALEFAIGGLPQILFNAIQIVIELFILTVFTIVNGTPSDPFEAVAGYCFANDTEVR